MIGTLMSIVSNIEEQKRLAKQSQVFLSMTQNMFSSLRKFFNCFQENMQQMISEVEFVSI